MLYISIFHLALLKSIFSEILTQFSISFLITSLQVFGSLCLLYTMSIPIYLEKLKHFHKYLAFPPCLLASLKQCLPSSQWVLPVPLILRWQRFLNNTLFNNWNLISCYMLHRMVEVREAFPCFHLCDDTKGQPQSDLTPAGSTCVWSKFLQSYAFLCAASVPNLILIRLTCILGLIVYTKNNCTFHTSSQRRMYAWS